VVLHNIVTPVLEARGTRNNIIHDIGSNEHNKGPVNHKMVHHDVLLLEFHDMWGLIQASHSIELLHCYPIIKDVS